MLDFLLSLALIALNIYILVYLFRLESIGCDCAMDFRRAYAIAYLIVSMVYSVTVAIVMHVFSNTSVGARLDGRVPGIVLGVMSLVMLIAGILYVVFGVQYINRLRDEKCACSQALARDVWQVVLYIKIAFYILIALLVIITLSAFGYRSARDAIMTDTPMFTDISSRGASSPSRKPGRGRK